MRSTVYVGLAVLVAVATACSADDDDASTATPQVTAADSAAAPTSELATAPAAASTAPEAVPPVLEAVPPVLEAVPPVPEAAPAAPAPAPSGGQFTAQFSSAAELDRFEWQVFHGGVDPFPRGDQPRTWQGDHDASCGAPTTLRQVDLLGETGPGPVKAAGDMVWWCAPGGDSAKGHLMTSISGIAYVSIDFSPRQTFHDVSRVCWDQNWTEMGGRKWTQVTVVPESLYRANGNRLDYVMPSLQGDVAVNGEYLDGDALMISMIRASTQVFVGQGFEWTDFGGFQTTDKARRFRQCLVDDGADLSLELERPDGTEVRKVPGASLPDGAVRVIFQDTTYDSIKGDMSSSDAAQTNTWHWDNVTIS